MPNFSNTAILIFIRTAEEEASAKQFCFSKNEEKNKAVAKCLNQNIIRIAKKAGIPYFIYSSDNQHGNNFGEKLGNAFGDIFNKGFEKVIAVGNDCLALNSDLLKKSVSQLKKAKSLIGPCEDGGAYLIGLAKDVFHKNKFESLAWESEHLLEDLSSYFEKINARTLFLPLANDIDNPQDLKRELAVLPKWSLILIELQGILNSIENLLVHAEIRLFSFLQKFNQPLRAPPFAF